MRLEPEKGSLYPIWRDPQTGLGFQEYTRDVEPGTVQYFCYYGTKLLCMAIADEIGGRMEGPNYITEISMPLPMLRRQFTPHREDLPDNFKHRADWFEAFLPIMIEGWETAHTLRYGERQKLKIRLDPG